MKADKPDTVVDLVLAALDQNGAALVLLDEQLRIRAATGAAERLVGQLPRGMSAVKVLCGKNVDRPVAEALAAGRAMQAVIPHPSGTGRLRVRGTPLRREGRHLGWVMTFEAESTSAAGAVLFHGMWSVDANMKRVFALIEKVAASDASVLVRGETGAGKELVAHALHRISARGKGPFRAINCAAVPQSLLESELFGHVRGSFTGAVRDAPGHFRLAHAGTLFLDEVAEMPLDVQAKMLRVLETREITPVGGGAPIPVDVRIVAATHRPLRQEVEAGRFRADLMYRLRVIPIFLPPLRERKGDILLLTDKILAEQNARGARQITRVAARAREALERHPWPGNVRELRNVLEYAYVVGEGPSLTERCLPPELTSEAAARSDGLVPYADLPALDLDERSGAEKIRIVRALERASGSRARAAKALGISRVTLWRRMTQLKL